MDFMVQGLNAIISETMLGFNERNEDGEYIYDRLIVRDAYSFNHSQHIDLILERADTCDCGRVITMPTFKKYSRYAIGINMKDYRAISETTEVELKKKCYVRAQSSFTRGYGIYSGTMGDTFLVFDRILIHPAII